MNDTTTTTTDLCGRCARPLAGVSVETVGDVRFCADCVDRCHESTDAGHICAIERAHAAARERETELTHTVDGRPASAESYDAMAAEATATAGGYEDTGQYFDDDE